MTEKELMKTAYIAARKEFDIIPSRCEEAFEEYYLKEGIFLITKNVLERQSLSDNDIFNTKLDNQIAYIEAINKIMEVPISKSILNSLKELKTIKQKQIENLK
jgi:hypothetical protein